jgi:DNA-binding NtrC family response regulator
MPRLSAVGISGLQAGEDVKWQPGVKGILMSAGQDPRLAGSPNHSSAWPFLQKPFAFEGLRQVIDSLLLAQPSEPD